MEGHEESVNEEFLTSDPCPITPAEGYICEETNVTPRTEQEGLELRAKKLRHLRNILEKDSRAVDMKWSLFVAACQSYRFNSVLKPFPPAFVKDGVKDIELLLRVVEESPPIAILLQQVTEPNVYHVRDYVIDLLYWVLITLREPYLKTVETECFDSVLSRVRCEAPFPKPNYIFQVAYYFRHPNESRWRNAAKGHRTIFAYHGTKLENFHSIMHHGLQQHLNKNSLFGKGIYLTSELSVSLPYSTTGFAWGASKVGSELACVALCELIDHEEYVKCQHASDQPNRNRVQAPESIAGEVPNKYYVVTNSEMVRIRYLLIYCKPPVKLVLQRNFLLSWLSRHKLLAFFIGIFIRVTLFIIL
ncbi:mono [ADP-ribose] polymerase PARP16-like isoform X2 [Ctenocephalides felis]|uniref:mono [ADP-ribose] polymerase PARP16-like isoform X2 n=1 Tax=Ctenocephalides felis TaxID=7515 RepID=UPI000E6E55A1|nr:mono [ADP-ribose] polymerase PARP16-like isoform X2 [Ctenocephalides felis]